MVWMLRDSPDYLVAPGDDAGPRRYRLSVCLLSDSRLVLDGVVFALSVGELWVWATYGFGSTAYTVLLWMTIFGNLANFAMTIWAFRADRMPMPPRPKPQPQIRLHLQDK